MDTNRKTASEKLKINWKTQK